MDVKITLSFVFTICSIYAPPNKYIDIKDLEHLLSQIQEPVMILGDFNSHNPLWGSEHLTPKGRVIETFMSQNDLCLYNDGSPTFLHSGNGAYSAIDLSFASQTLFDRFSWDVHEDCSGSDHFPIILREKGRDLTQSYDKSPYTNGNVKRAKWQHKQRHKKSSIKQWLRTDLGRSVGVTTATQLVWLTGLRAHLPTNRNSDHITIH